MNFQKDLLASIVVFLVALPLCMGIAIASGVPVAAGLITGIVGGLIVAPLAGCPLQVSGPAAGLAVLIFEAVQRHGLEMLGIIVLIAGVLQLVAGLCKMGQWFRAVSPAVIRGMLAGIGVLIFASQFHVMIDDKPRSNGIMNLVTIPSAIGKAMSVPHLGSEESRQLRSDLLHSVGELHRRQVTLEEQVAEHRIEKQLDESEESQPVGQQPAPSDTATITHLTEQQVAIQKDLQAVLERVQGSQASLGDYEQQEAVTNAAQHALHQVDVALEDIREDDVAQAKKSQEASVESFEHFLARMKNHDIAAQLGILTIGVIILWQMFAPAKLKMIPGPLLGVSLATAIAAVMYLPVLFVEVPDSLLDDVHILNLSLLQAAAWGPLVGTGIVMAIVASAETLLSATAVDQLHTGPRARYDRELASQGVGNIICGCLGALPMTGVIVRSSANVHAGATSRWSTFMHGVWLLIFVSGLAFVLRMIPTSSLAAVLVFTGYKLVNPKSVRELREFGWGEVVIYAATLASIVAIDLLTGVLVGIGLAVAKLMLTFSHLNVRLEEQPQERKAILHLEGAATFIRLPKLAASLEQVPPGTALHVEFNQLDYIDHACLDLLMNWARQHATTGGELIIDWESLHARFRRDGNGTSDSPNSTEREVA